MTTQAIRTSNIRDVQLFDRNARELDLCNGHYDDLCRDLSVDINDLVATALFQAEFRNFLPANNTDTVDVTIRIRDRMITVEKMDGTRERKTIDLSTLSHTRETEGINRDILQTANAIYLECVDEDRRSHRSLRDRASRYDDYDSRRERSSSPRPRHRHHDSTRHSEVDATQTRLNLLRNRAEQLQNEPQSNTRLEEDLTRLEEQIRTLEQRLQITPPVSTEPQERMQTLLDRLNSVEQSIANPPRTETTITPTLLNPPRITEIEPIQPTLSNEEFNTLMNLSDTLSAQDHAGSTLFPDALQHTFETIPLNIRNGVFYQTYLLCDPRSVPNPWPIGQKLFTGSHPESIQADNICRGHAIRHYLLLTLASDLGAHRNAPAELLERFNRFSEEDRNAIYTQLQYILQRERQDEDNRDYAAHVFHTTATGTERNNAMIRVLGNRIAEYHRDCNQARLEFIVAEFEAAKRRLQEENARLIYNSSAAV